MLSDAIIKEFENTLDQFLDNSMEISLLNTDEEIIYSTNKNRGTYHQVYGSLLSLQREHTLYFQIDGLDALITGVFIDKKVVVYIVIIGHKNEINPFVTVLKMAIEIRVRYEEEQNKNKEERTLNGQILKELLKSGERNKKNLKDLMERGNYQMDVPRTLILIETNNMIDMEVIENTNFYYDSNQDIVTIYQKDIVILKDCRRNNDNNTYYQSYIRHIRENTVLKDKILIANPSPSLNEVSLNYERLCWLKENVDKYREAGHTRNIFLRDYFDFYMMAQIPMSLYQSMYEPVLKNKVFDVCEFLSIMHVITRNNYNLTQSSKDLYMHRNTFLYKFEKIKKLWNIDPVNIEADRFFLKGLSFYLMTSKAREG